MRFSTLINETEGVIQSLLYPITAFSFAFDFFCGDVISFFSGLQKVGLVNCLIGLKLADSFYSCWGIVI